MQLAFTKVEGLGNDFLLVDMRDGTLAEASSAFEQLQPLAQAICDRRRGVGADGILVVGPGTDDSAATMMVINHDGSRPEMCGNGLRCVAMVVAEDGGPSQFAVLTDNGALGCSVEFLDGEASVEVDMGVATMLGQREVAEREFTAVSVGNPHAICFVSGDPEALARELGPVVEGDAQFPGRTNVEFVRVEPDGGLTVWVWERGCGITDACGTGACASAAAAVAASLAPADKPLRVSLPGGVLSITVPSQPGVGIRMRGPARRVFVGSITLP